VLKSKRGGRRSTVSFGQSTQQQTQQNQQSQQQSQQDIEDETQNQISTDTSGEENPAFDAFRKMTDDEKADAITEAMKEAPPSFLPDNPSQRLLWYLGGDDKPTIVSDQQLNAMPGKDIYRQVGGIRDTTLGVTLSSQAIANQVMTGDFTRYAENWGTAHGGGTAFGRAIYFGASYTEIQNGYGVAYLRGQRDSTMFRCKIDPKSKGMTYSALRSAVAKEMNSGSKLGRALSRISNSDDRETIYALSKSIDWTHDGSYDYHMIYNRGCLVASSRMKHNASDSRW